MIQGHFRSLLTGGTLSCEMQNCCPEQYPRQEGPPVCAVCCQGYNVCLVCCRGCWGVDCFMELVPGPTPCMLKGIGVDIDLKNATRKETCGLDPGHSYWLEPFNDDNGVREDDIECAIRSALDVKLEFWAPCIDGKPLQMTKLTFPSDPGNFYYTCKANPTWTRGSLQTQIVCYTVGTKVDRKSILVKNIAVRNSISPAWYLCVWLLCWVLILQLNQ